MKYYLITLLIAASFITNAQEFITDDMMETTAMAKDGELKILYFTASWCGPCKMMKPIMKAVDADESLEVTVYKMDIDNNYTDDILGVNSVPTYYYIKNGVKLGQSRGAKRQPVIEKMVEKYSAMQADGDPLEYAPTPSKLKPIAGTHRTLTVKNLNTIWHDFENCKQLSKSISKQLDDPKDLECAVILAKRAAEFKEDAAVYATLSTLYQKLENTTAAKKAIKKAISLAKENKDKELTVYEEALQALK